MNQNILILKKCIEDIPILYVRKENGGRRGNIFLLHKFLDDKNSELPLAYELAEEGYFVIIPDIRGHGERNTLKGHKYNFQNMLDDARNTVEDMEKILQNIHESEQQERTLKHTGVIGTSFGASIALMAGYMMREISYVVCLIGTCNLRYIIENRLLEVWRSFSVSRKIIDYEKALDKLETLDCLKNYNSENIKPMLFLDGKLDMTIPYKEKIEFYQELESIYSKAGMKDDITYKFYSNTGHKVNTDMIRTLLAWLNKLTINTIC